MSIDIAIEIGGGASSTDRLSRLLNEHQRILAAATATANNAGGGRGKQAKRRYDGALHRTAKYFEQLQRLETEIRALGGTIPADEPKPVPKPKLIPELVGPQQPDPRTMTREALRAEDTQLDRVRKASKICTITDRHRAVRSALGAFAAADIRTRAAARRSEAAKRGAVTRAKRKAAGLPPKHLECFMPPAGGWTDADRVH